MVAKTKNAPVNTQEERLDPTIICRKDMLKIILENTVVEIGIADETVRTFKRGIPA